jgi:O-antigen/teichoic acid export membrane protein
MIDVRRSNVTEALTYMLPSKQACVLSGSGFSRLGGYLGKMPRLWRIWRAALHGSPFLRDVGFLTSGVFIAQLVALLASPVLTRLFGPEEFGVFSLVLAAAGIVSVFATLRLENIIPALRRPAAALHLLQILILVSFAVSLLTLLAVALFRAPIAAFFSLPPQGAGLLFLLPPIISTFALYSGLRSWLIRKGLFAPIGRAQVPRAVANLAVSILLGLAEPFARIPGLALAVGQAAGDLIYAGALARQLRRRDIRFLMRPHARRIAVTLRANKAMVGTLVSSQALAAIYGRLPIIVIASAFGPTQAGWYALGERIVGAPSALVAGSIGEVYRQRAAVAHRTGRPFDDLMRRVLLMTLGLSVAPFTLAMILTPYFIGPVFGQAWEAADFTVVVLLFGALIGFNSMPVDKAAIITGASGFILAWHALRFSLEAVGAILALLGWIGYETYLVFVVAGRSILMVWDTLVCLGLARGTGQ